MEQRENGLSEHDSIFVPASALRLERRRTEYGTLKDLPDDELADPDELERMVYKEMWWPIWQLPQQRCECPIRPTIDEDGKPNWGAFGTVDFDCYKPKDIGVSKKLREMNEYLRELGWTFEMILTRIPGLAKYEILRHVRNGILDIGDITDGNMYELALTQVRISRLREEIKRFKEWRCRRQGERTEAFWRKMGC